MLRKLIKQARALLTGNGGPLRSAVASEIEEIKVPAAITREQLIQVQMEQWPDSHILSHENAFSYWPDKLELSKQNVFRQIAWCVCTNPNGVFYQCGKRPDGSYRFHGYRYGLEPQEYLSPFY